MEQSAAWFPIVYRDFYDFPRSFFVHTASGWLFFGGQFDDALDDYPEEFTAYEMGDLGPDNFDGDWSVIPQSARRRLGTVPLDGDSFDPSRRAYVRLVVTRLSTGDV